MRERVLSAYIQKKGVFGEWIKERTEDCLPGLYSGARAVIISGNVVSGPASLDANYYDTSAGTEDAKELRRESERTGSVKDQSSDALLKHITVYTTPGAKPRT